MAALRVVVAGASGIGRHHAKWHHRAGSAVVGFWGSSEASCAATERLLRQTFPFSGKGYWELDRLLAQERPDAVDVCVPNELHYTCALKALEAGCHVLCEKPLVWQAGEDPARLLERARQLVDIAGQKGLLLGICTQYAASLPHYRQFYEAGRGPLAEIVNFYAEMESVSRGRRRDGETLWIDMGPHPLSLLLGWMPGGVLDVDTLRADFSGSQARVDFDFVSENRRCRSQILIRDRQEGQPVRRFGVNDFVVDFQGCAGADGTYQAVLRQGEREVAGEDFMYLLIEQFTWAVEQRQPPLAGGAVGVRNLELQVQILQRAQGRW